MLAYFKRLKLKLQFTGWLQYILPGLVALFLLLTAVLFFIFDVDLLMYFFGTIGLLLFAITLFDVITIKFGLRPKEGVPARRDGMDAFDLMRARTACRSFQNRTLTEADKTELLNVVHETNDVHEDNIGQNKVRFEYINERLTVWPVVGAQEFLVAIAPKNYSRESVIDVGRNLQKVVHHATEMGLATCWIGPGADQTSIRKHLGDRLNPSEDHIICVCAVGYKSWFKPLVLRIASIPQHKRKPISSLFFTDAQFKNGLDENASPFRRFGRCFEVCQWGPSSFNSQTTRCLAVLDDDGLTTRFDFYTATTSKFYAPVALGIWCANWEIGCEALGIKGHFEVLESEITKDSGEAPVYGASWMLDKHQD